MSRSHLVTFSDESMSRAAQLCIESAARVGDVDDSLRWYYDDFLETDFYKQNIDLLSQPRGLGFWAWKPWIIDLAIRGIINGRQFEENSFYPPKDGDTLIYADAGIEFIAPVQPIIDRMDQDVWLFGNNWEHAHWCKADVVAAVWPTTDREFWKGDPIGWSRFGKQVQASVIFFRVSDYSRRFVQEWLAWCLTRVPVDSQVGLSCGHWWKGDAWSRCPKCGDVAVENRSEYLIDDSPSRNPNHPEFREHRHDQAILTTLAYREGIKLHYWPAVYNRGGSPEFVYEKLPEYAGDDYPSPLFHHHRRRNHEWPSMLGRLWANLHPKYYK